MRLLDKQTVSMMVLQAAFLTMPPSASSLQLKPAPGANAVLCSASDRGDVEAVRRQLANRANVNTRCGLGSTPLINAASSGHIDIVHILLAKGADSNAVWTGREGRNTTALMWAARNGHVGVVDALLLHGADVNAQDIERRTPLLKAVTSSGMLIRHAAGLLPRDSKSKTAVLIVPRTKNYVRIVLTLLAKGARLDHVDQAGGNALDIASVFGDIDMISILKKAGLKNKLAAIDTFCDGIAAYRSTLCRLTWRCSRRRSPDACAPRLSARR